jgi:Xaa-Pro aminopeptidase
MLDLSSAGPAHAARRDRLQKSLPSGVCALVLSGDAPPRTYAASTYPFRAASHFLYFVGVSFRRAALLFDGGASTLFLEPSTPADALWHGPSPSFGEIAAKTGLRVESIDGLASRLSGRQVATLAAIDALTRAWQSKLLGREITPGAHEGADRTLAEAVIAMRLVHDESAQAELRRAANITVDCHRRGMGATKPGLYERHVRAAMEEPMWAAGAAPAYGSIVTTHGEVLHNDAYHHELHYGDLLLADVGSEAPSGFASDVTRTWPVSGRFSPTQRAVYDVVLNAQHAAIAAVRPGVRYRDVHRVASEVIARGLVDLGILRGDPRELVEDGVHALFFPHGVGHLLGLDVHDMEDLGDLAGYAKGRERSQQFGLSYLRLDRDLEAGMAVTIEPGIYFVPAILEHEDLIKQAGDRLVQKELAKFKDVRGIRIEDDVLVTDHGSEVLTHAIPKAADAVQAAVGHA